MGWRQPVCSIARTQTVCAVMDSGPLSPRRNITHRINEVSEECVMNLLVLLIVLLFLFGGGGFYVGGPAVGGSLGGLILLVLIVMLVTGRLGRA